MPYRYEQTEAKRYLGKLLFHDPIRTNRIDINTGQPKDLPAGTSFGGTLNATDPLIQKIFPKTGNATGAEVHDIVAATTQTGSCGACHIGEAAGKAGQLINLNVGAEGRGYTDENGVFFPRRRPQPILAKLRTAPIFPGDTLVDALPTLTDIWVDHGTNVVTTPAYFYHYPNPPGATQPAGGYGGPEPTTARDRTTRPARQRRAHVAVDGRLRIQQPPVARWFRRQSAVDTGFTQSEY